MRITCDSHGVAEVNPGLGTVSRAGPPVALREKAHHLLRESSCACTHLSVPNRLSFAEQMRYNQRALKKFLSAPRLDLKTGCIKRNGIRLG